MKPSLTTSEDAILIVDDETHILSALKRVLSDDPVVIYTAESGERGMVILEDAPVKVIVSDHRMPGMSGTDFLSRVRLKYPGIVRIMLTGYASIDAAINAINEGEIYRFLVKPWNDHEILLTIRAALEKYNLEEENRRLLRIVRGQMETLKSIEKQYPGITHTKRDEKGRIVVDDTISDEEFESLIRSLNESMP